MLLATVSTISAQSWRSSLFPANWKPGFKDTAGRFLHDFSYAGYQRGEKNIPVIRKRITDITKSPYFADAAGKDDITSKLQQALNDVGKAGGGVVYLPEGTYKINVSATEKNSIKISYSNTVLRGAGVNKTFIYNDQSNIRDVSVIDVKPLSQGDWMGKGTNTVSITTDLLEPTNIIPVTSVKGFKVGDWVLLRSDVTTGFIEEHQMTNLWAKGMNGTMFYRYIIAVDKKTKSLTIDAPTRYFLKKRDNARLYIVQPLLSEVGIEHFSIANRESILPGLGDVDFGKPGTGAYEIHGSNFIRISNAIHCWINNINTYKPVENIQDIHLVSNGILLSRSRFITVDSCDFQKPQYKGEGGNGYMYILAGNDCLVKNSRGGNGRHNFDFKSMQSNGNVIFRCRAENSRLASDFHMHLSMANLFDNVTVNKDLLEAKFRPYGSLPNMHGWPTTQSVFWNTNGEAYMKGKDCIVESAQFGWGYIIGSRGPASAVKTAPFFGVLNKYTFNSSPEDFTEGIGQGDLLQPASLYEDQLQKRIKRESAATK